jgi:HSP20 family molecular chaperone IbpA
MAKTEIAKSGETSVTRPRDIFSAMRDEMDRMFERFDSDWPRWPSAYRPTGGVAMVVPELDVRENGNAFVIEAELPGVAEKDVTVTLANGLLTIKGEKKVGRGGRASSTIAPSAASARSSARCGCPTRSTTARSRHASTRACSRSRRPSGRRP